MDVTRSDTNRFGGPVALGWFAALALAASSITATRTGIDSRAADEDMVKAPPNVLLIVADDLGYDDSTLFNRNSPARTPSLRELADDGVLFTRHYADATCTPSRVSIMTGLYAERMGFRHNGLEIPPEVTTLPEALSGAGYQTHLVGKWHAGEVREASLPLSQGFDTFFGFHNQWELAGAVSHENRGIQRPTYINPWLRQDNGDLVRHTGHLTDILSDRSVQLIKSLADSEQPWFLYHAFLAPHSPIQPAQRFKNKRPDTEEGRYLALVDHLDEVVGKLINALVESGQYDDTIVVFASDNGGTNRERNNNFPWHGKKDETYEGTFRTPLVIKLARGEAGGKLYDWTVMNTDIYPTVLAATGIPLPPDLDGVSLLPFIFSDDPAPRTDRTWEKFLWNVDAMTYSFLTADGRWRLSNAFGFPPHLYDLETHPYGDRDTAELNGSEVKDLVARFNRQSWEKSLITVQSAPGVVAGVTEYTGADMNRTPFRHSFSFGIEVPPHARPAAHHFYAGQTGVWSLTTNEQGSLQLDVGNMRLNGEQLNHTRCNDIVITGHFQPSAMFVKTETAQVLKLYVNGELQDLKDRPTFIPPDLESVENPTVVHGGGRAIFSNQLLGSSADPFNPRVALEFKEMFYTLREEGKLQRAELGPMRESLCVDWRRDS